MQGYFEGNPVTDPEFDGNAFVPYIHGMGIISDELFEVTLFLSFFFCNLFSKHIGLFVSM